MPSNPSAARRRLNDILYHIDLAQSFVTGLSYEAFTDDLLRFHAATRCLEIVSEASRRLPDELKARHPSIAWKAMAGAGNVYRHDYDYVAARRIWDTLQIAMPPLRAVVARELAALDKSSWASTRNRSRAAQVRTTHNCAVTPPST